MFWNELYCDRYAVAGSRVNEPNSGHPDFDSIDAVNGVKAFDSNDSLSRSFL